MQLKLFGNYVMSFCIYVYIVFMIDKIVNRKKIVFVLCLTDQERRLSLQKVLQLFHSRKNVKNSNTFLKNHRL